MTRVYAYPAAAATALAVVAYAAHSLYSAGWDAGTAACKAELAKAADAARAEVERREVASGQATDSMLQFLAAQLPPIEIKTHETVERIRTVYRDHPLPAVCVWPDGVQAELRAARERANAASRL